MYVRNVASRGLNMAEVLVTYRILPKDAEVDVEKLLKEFEKRFKVHSSEIQPLAFGIKVIILKVILPEEEGSTDKFEEELRKIEGVGEFEIIESTRIGF